jgi:hypothetical protein
MVDPEAFGREADQMRGATAWAETADAGRAGVDTAE